MGIFSLRLACINDINTRNILRRELVLLFIGKFNVDIAIGICTFPTVFYSPMFD